MWGHHKASSQSQSEVIPGRKELESPWLPKVFLNVCHVHEDFLNVANANHITKQTQLRLGNQCLTLTGLGMLPGAWQTHLFEMLTHGSTWRLCWGRGACCHSNANNPALRDFCAALLLQHHHFGDPFSNRMNACVSWDCPLSLGGLVRAELGLPQPIRCPCLPPPRGGQSDCWWSLLDRELLHSGACPHHT